MAPEEIRLDARGLTLAALRWRNGDVHRVLCLHGWLDNAASFSRLGPLLSGCDVVALDLPGHGRSAHRGAGTLQYFVEYLADVVAALAALGWDDAVLLGHSMGAGICTGVAATCPERVRALCLVEGLAPQPEDAGKTVGRLRGAILADRRGPGTSAGYADMAAAVAARGKGHWPLPGDAAVALLERALTRSADGLLRWHTDPRLRQPSALRLGPAQVEALLAAVRCPALLVGARGGLFADPASHGATAIAGLKAVVLAGGHHLHLEREQAPAVAGQVLDFLAG